MPIPGYRELAEMRKQKTVEKQKQNTYLRNEVNMCVNQYNNASKNQREKKDLNYQGTYTWWCTKLSNTFTSHTQYLRDHLCFKENETFVSIENVQRLLNMLVDRSPKQKPELKQFLYEKRYNIRKIENMTNRRLTVKQNSINTIYSFYENYKTEWHFDWANVSTFQLQPLNKIIPHPDARTQATQQWDDSYIVFVGKVHPINQLISNLKHMQNAWGLLIMSSEGKIETLDTRSANIYNVKNPEEVLSRLFAEPQEEGNFQVSNVKCQILLAPAHVQHYTVDIRLPSRVNVLAERQLYWNDDQEVSEEVLKPLITLSTIEAPELVIPLHKITVNRASDLGRQIENVKPTIAEYWVTMTKTLTKLKVLRFYAEMSWVIDFTNKDVKSLDTKLGLNSTGDKQYEERRLALDRVIARAFKSTGGNSIWPVNSAYLKYTNLRDWERQIQYYKEIIKKSTHFTDGQSLIDFEEKEIDLIFNSDLDTETSRTLKDQVMATKMKAKHERLDDIINNQESIGPEVFTKLRCPFEGDDISHVLSFTKKDPSKQNRNDYMNGEIDWNAYIEATWGHSWNKNHQFIIHVPRKRELEVVSVCGGQPEKVKDMNADPRGVGMQANVVKSVMRTLNAREYTEKTYGSQPPPDNLNKGIGTSRNPEIENQKSIETSLANTNKMNEYYRSYVNFKQRFIHNRKMYISNHIWNSNLQKIDAKNKYNALSMLQLYVDLIQVDKKEALQDKYYMVQIKNKYHLLHENEVTPWTCESFININGKHFGFWHNDFYWKNETNSTSFGGFVEIENSKPKWGPAIVSIDDQKYTQAIELFGYNILTITIENTKYKYIGKVDGNANICYAIPEFGYVHPKIMHADSFVFDNFYITLRNNEYQKVPVKRMFESSPMKHINIDFYISFTFAISDNDKTLTEKFRRYYFNMMPIEPDYDYNFLFLNLQRRNVAAYEDINNRIIRKKTTLKDTPQTLHIKNSLWYDAQFSHYSLPFYVSNLPPRSEINKNKTFLHAFIAISNLLFTIRNGYSDSKLESNYTKISKFIKNILQDNTEIDNLYDYIQRFDFPNQKYFSLPYDRSNYPKPGAKRSNTDETDEFISEENMDPTEYAALVATRNNIKSSKARNPSNRTLKQFELTQGGLKFPENWEEKDMSYDLIEDLEYGMKTLQLWQQSTKQYIDTILIQPISKLTTESSLKIDDGHELQDSSNNLSINLDESDSESE